MDPVGKSEIPDLLHAADIGLHVLADVELFRTAVSPNKVFDYMAASLVTVTNCPGLVSDLVQRSGGGLGVGPTKRSEEHTSELQSLMRISYAVFCLKKKKKENANTNI